jgi:hypothetical protein
MLLSRLPPRESCSDGRRLWDWLTSQANVVDAVL